MSQHYFATEYEGRPIEVLMGWDRPLQGYFLVVEWKDDDDSDEGDPYLYANLDDPLLPRAHPRSLTPFVEKLEQLGIRVPHKMIANVLMDGAANAGNKKTRYVSLDSNGDDDEEP